MKFSMIVTLVSAVVVAWVWLMRCLDRKFVFVVSATVV